MSDDAVRELVDRAAIRDLLLRYAHGVDRRDLDAVAACFTADASYKGSLGEGSIEVALRALRERMGQYSSTMHLVANQLVSIDGDRADSETYAIAYHQLAEGEERRSLAVGVRYLDRLVRRADGWRICHREVKLEWQRYDELV
jgi:3-phenylpropionate/cinnamic acid dioxygenase small subunit